MARPAAVLEILVDARTGAASSKLARLEGQLRGVAATSGKTSTVLSRLGTAAKYTGVAAAGIGIAAVKASMDFKQSMTQVYTQAGSSRKEVGKLSDQVLDLAKKSIYGPKELADALFHVESVGFRGAKAMHVLNAAQKAATVGNADLEDTTYALVSALETGIKGTGNLTKTIGTLDAIVGQGDMRMEDLTAALSSGVLPAAKNFGLSLKDVGAALDTLTARGQPAQISATRLRMTFSLLAAPSAKAAEELKSVGLSADALGETMQKRGLIPAVQMLADHLKDAGDKAQQAALLSKAFGGGRSSATIMTLVQNVDDLKDRYQGVAKAEGNFNDKLKAAKATPINQLKTAWSSIQVLLVKLGDKIVPGVTKAFTDVVDVVTDPKLTSQEKLSKIAEMAANALAGLVPKAAVVGLHAGEAIAGGIIHSFYSGNLLTKATIVAALMALFGGAGTFRAVGAAVARPIVSAITASMVAETTMSGLRMAGMSTAGTALGGALAKASSLAIPGAFAAVGIGNIVYSAVQRDMTSAGEKAGGALIGGIIGSVVPGVGTIAGALAGAGIGSIAGGLLGGLFGGTEKKVVTGAMRARHAIHSIGAAYRAEQGAVHDYTRSQKEVDKAHEQVRRTSRQVKDAEKHYQEVLKHHSIYSAPAIKADHQLTRATRAHTQALHAEKQAQKISGEERKIVSHQIQIQYQRVRELNSGLKEQVRHLAHHYVTAKQAGASDEKLTRIYKKWTDRSDQQSKAESRLQNILRDAVTQIGPKFAKSLQDNTLGASHLQHAFNDLYRSTSPVISAQANLQKKFQGNQRELQQTDHFLTSDLIKPLGTAKDRTKDMSDQWGRSQKDVSHSIDRLNGNLGDFFSTVYHGQSITKNNTAKSLKAFGAKLPDFSLQNPKGHATGGVVGGSGSGDRPFGFLPAGSFVLNREATKGFGFDKGGMVPVALEPGERYFLPEEVRRIGLKKLAAANAAIPRFQDGGLVGLAKGGLMPNFGGHPSNVSPAISKLIGILQGRFPLAVTSTTDGVHADGSYHYKGEAVDLSAAAQVMFQASEWIKRSGMYRQLTEGIHNPNLAVQNGKIFSGAGPFGAVWADHADHIHLAIAGALSGAFGGVAQKIARVILKGPDGLLKDLGQGALDKMRDAANAYIAKKSAMGLDVGGGGGALSKAQLASLWRSTGSNGNPNLMAAIALAESGGNPGVTNSIGARGLYQIMPGTAKAVGFDYGRLTDPAYNTKAAHAVLAAQGLGAWETYTEGTYRQYLRKGGLVGLDKGGFIHHFLHHLSLKHSGKRKKRIGHLVDRIKKLGLPDDVATQIKKLDRDASIYADLAERASGVTADGTPAKVFGPGGLALDQAGWLHKELDALWPLRNALIGADGLLLEKEKRVDKLLKQSRDEERDLKRKKGPADRRIKKLEAKDKLTREDRRKLENLQARGLSAAQHKRLRELQGKKHLSGSERSELHHLENHKLTADERSELRHLSQKSTLSAKERRELARLKDASHGSGIRLGALHDKIIPALKDRSGKLHDAEQNWRSKLEDVQGIGSPMRRYKSLRSPIDTRFGGELLQVQLDLRDLGQQAGSQDNGPGGMSIDQLLDFARLVRVGAFDSDLKLPGYAKGIRRAPGGLAIVGEEGPEVVDLHPGSRVYSNREAFGSGGGDVYLLADIYVGGEKIDERVKVQLRKARREEEQQLRAEVRV